MIVVIISICLIFFYKDINKNDINKLFLLFIMFLNYIKYQLKCFLFKNKLYLCYIKKNKL